MIRGMTGYGNVPFSLGKVKGIIEVKSQNHRYFDPVFYLPVGFSAVENKIKTMMSKGIKRGRVTISVKITEKAEQNVQFNKNVVAEYLKQSKRLQREFKLENNLTLADIIRLPGVIETKECFVSVDKLWPVVDRGMKKAMRSLIKMREREGKSLELNIKDILKRMMTQSKSIETRQKALNKDKKKRLSSDEFTSFQKSTDIDEELTRLKHYIEECQTLLKTGGIVGKKLDFIAQEMHRETNTIGSKLQERIVSNAVISIKGKVEKLREQAQNIE